MAAESKSGWRAAEVAGQREGRGQQKKGKSLTGGDKRQREEYGCSVKRPFLL